MPSIATDVRGLETAWPRRMLRALAVFSFLLVLALLAAGIVLTHEQSKRELLANLKARSVTTADFAATEFSEQALRERHTAARFLSGNRRLGPEFRRVLSTFDGTAGALLDSSGRVLEIAPADNAVLGTIVTARYAHLRRAEQGHDAVSAVVRSVVRDEPVVAVAVPFATPQGRRVFSAAYPVAGSVLANLVAHTISYPQHAVLLIDTSGAIAAASPRTTAPTLAGAHPALSAAVARASHGPVDIAGVHSTFVVTSIPGTPLRVVIAVPNSRLFMTTGGWALWLPWLVFALITVLGSVVLALLSRSLAAHSRLQVLTTQLAQAARTDPGTGLPNRRSLEERLAQASAYANRYQEPLSVLAIDLDEFKHINDRYGHAVGDEVLNGIAECMRIVFRGSDIFGRWGGDEFLAVLPGTGPEALLAGERLCAEVARLDMSEWGVSERIAVSVGCAAASNVSPRDLLLAADDSLYQAKREGRGRVAIAH